MTVAIWGPFTFSVDMNKGLTFSDYTRKTSYKTETKENGKNKPLTIDKGSDLSTISFKVQLVASLGVDVGAEADRWHEACEAGKPHPLTIGGVRQGQNQWQLKDVTESAVFYDPEINKVAAMLQINFAEYRGAGAAESTSSSGGKKPAAQKPPKKPVDNVPNAIDNTPITQRPPSVQCPVKPSSSQSGGIFGS